MHILLLLFRLLAKRESHCIVSSSCHLFTLCNKRWPALQKRCKTSRWKVCLLKKCWKGGNWGSCLIRQEMTEMCQPLKIFHTSLTLESTQVSFLGEALDNIIFFLSESLSFDCWIAHNLWQMIGEIHSLYLCLDYFYNNCVILEW